MDNSQKINIMAMLHGFARRLDANNQQNMAKTIQGHVSKQLPNDMLEFTIDSNSPFTLPKISIPQAFSKYNREPTQVNDKGYYVSNDYYLGGESGLGGGTASMYPRGNLTTGTFHPISVKSWETRDKDKYYHTGGPNGHILRSQDEKAYQHLDQDNNLNHVTPKSILHSAVQGIMHVSGSLQSLLPGLPALPNFPGLPNLPSIPGIGTNPLQGITHISEQGILHIADGVLQGIVPGQASSGILHLAQNAITHTSLNGITTIASLAQAIHIVPGQNQGLTIGSPSGSYLFSTNDIPIPSLPTIVNVLGSISASMNISAGGSISASGGISSGGSSVMTEPIPPGLIYAPVTVTGSRGGNVALQSLLSGLATLGLIIDDTTT